MTSIYRVMAVVVLSSCRTAHHDMFIFQVHKGLKLSEEIAAEVGEQLLVEYMTDIAKATVANAARDKRLALFQKRLWDKKALALLTETTETYG